MYWSLLVSLLLTLIMYFETEGVLWWYSPISNSLRFESWWVTDVTSPCWLLTQYFFDGRVYFASEHHLARLSFLSENTNTLYFWVTWSLSFFLLQSLVNDTRKIWTWEHEVWFPFDGWMLWKLWTFHLLVNIAKLVLWVANNAVLVV